MKVLLSKAVILIQLLGLFALLEISGCRRATYVNDVVPSLPCKVEGACDATIIKFIDSLTKSGITVITMGQSFLISIPACALFEDETPHLACSSYGLLNDIASFLKQFRKIEIHVTSYSSKYISVQRERALTLARSRVVGEYLWSQGIDSRFIFTQGLGSDKPIVSSLLGGDRSPNARIEITFRRAVA
ncbi:MAG: OmpA family protein [Legionella sp.]|nr:OmpA family protein [Legionella sp.]